ncbi:putative trypanothione synthetase [Leishmania major strain Friedlin]|uniref:Trypanothione synthetase n=10 Tax=Leishmania TaxID=38568 RepID=Q711P7_LEIMA|nr:putative trypanothione synthetase [Leishmania major strain Friedlin]2VOB_A Chain A, Trypanothione Synthetase [Leishmania major]2VOB_B Chain B, Trypanothione Synthetase [Leishmania major]2VPS_A Chain A, TRYPANOTHIONE SYNTHETASE [Leishmania major]CAC83968.1 trypanothione synthetase [Leishmania major]CAG9576795.1 trypanothione_synthetase_-_putative [Leishmania major strain Friedlin]CBZ12255.1 putative trypanothione synthetase [Leishmania major strain Friedlin]|eukprot:XP_003721994.1 putative trypanothione synthetase [Leishmania major strain Friedlin]
MSSLQRASVSFNKPGHIPFGAVQGYAPGGVPAYSNKHDHYFSGERNIEDNIFFGFKYQCVEFARRWLLVRKGLLLPDVNWACHIFQLKEVRDAATTESFAVLQVRNGTTTKPEADALLVYPSTDANPVGHVGTITEVGDDYVCVADQNYRFHKWESSCAYKLKLDHRDGIWTIIDDIDADEIEIPLGWLTFPGRANRPEGAPPVALHPSLHFKEPPKPYLLRRNFLPTESKANWLDMNNPAERLFVEEFGMDVSRTRLEEKVVSYYESNHEFHLRCVAYGTQLHAIFMEATAQVIESDEKLRLFAIPEEFWPRIRHSWKYQQTYISGRFDFAFNNETGEVKCFEYNADSASTLLECGLIQQKWAESVGLDKQDTRGSGFAVERNLKMAWANSGATGRVHFCVDEEREEQYTALYCMQAAEAVGLEGKLCILFDEFRFDDNGHVVDSDGVRVRNVWKTWMWESAITDYYAAREERGENWKPSPKDKVRLCDLLLGDDWEILYFEPMWKVIPSNKAILPMIYHNHPEHPAILKAEYELTDELRKHGYAKKPIVGRVGSNVIITSGDGVVHAESGGKYGKRNMIYQQLFELKKQDDYYAIIGGWMIGDAFSGTGIREDKSVITGVDSPFAAVRIKTDKLPHPVTLKDIDKMAEDE